ncbi:MAG: 4-hydroxy-3-methylbut-2-enyl diphosphate reductase [Planctomycetes bacterium]|nr:4-hydroxy-3-methylbut-2-enyl diphosphate reductase [Planctomycetota bacterium]
MKVILAESLGMCFGVHDALRQAAEVESPRETTIYGELVHNEVVLHQLERRGFQQTAERDRHELPPTEAVLITAHGISDQSRLRLLDAGKQLIDTTCPLVRRVHEAARQLERDGYHVLILGKTGHVEVQGVVEDLRACDVIGSPGQVRAYPYARLGIVCQTTLPPHVADELCRQIEAANPQAEVRRVDTICEPTRRRQQAMRELLSQVQAVVVVGGRNSNNTLQLVSVCRQQEVPVLHVESAAGLDFDWLAQFETIGLTAGTSTLDETICEVRDAIAAGTLLKP